MEYFGIQEIHYRWSIGNTPGMLINPKLWGEDTIDTQNLQKMNIEKLFIIKPPKDEYIFSKTKLFSEKPL